ncbi:transcriptional activator, putative [Candida dubliniensis CD36]|uniref:Transcriptional activator, putative n=3 Tax=Candida TaxID=5475 RepID=B9WN82_CANDC|nr:transcriptional activator, putative [Candida dubliniensis CD36]CAX40549.1 transcriptional activator, putative [Candida dubliniensis CD36]
MSANLQIKLEDALDDILKSAGFMFEIINHNREQSNLIAGPNNELIQQSIVQQLNDNIQKFNDILDQTVSKFNDAKWCVAVMIENKQKLEELKIKEDGERQKRDAEAKRLKKEMKAKKKAEKEAKAAAKAREKEEKAAAKVKEEQAKAAAKVKEEQAKAAAKVKEEQAKAAAKAREEETKAAAKAREEQAKAATRAREEQARAVAIEKMKEVAAKTKAAMEREKREKEALKKKAEEEARAAARAREEKQKFDNFDDFLGIDIPDADETIDEDMLSSMNYEDLGLDNPIQASPNALQTQTIDDTPMGTDSASLDLNNILDNDESILAGLNMNLLDDANTFNDNEEFDVDSFLNQFGN